MMSPGAAAAIAATGSVKLQDPSGQTVIVAACAVRAKMAIEPAEMVASTAADEVRDERKRLICIIELLLEIAFDTKLFNGTPKNSHCVSKTRLGGNWTCTPITDTPNGRLVMC